MVGNFDIAGCRRISVDDEMDQKNISLENQKDILQDVIGSKFPGSARALFEGCSGCTFEQRRVVRRQQADGQWLCAAPYGYIISARKEFEIVATEAAVVRQIFSLYNSGWGYKKIANYLTEQGIPTPRMSEQTRMEAEGKACKRNAKSAWAIVTVQGILDNDFYIGTLRQSKYTRAKINGKDVKRDDEHIVIENHHQAVIDYRAFATTRALREKRSRSNYRGVKKTTMYIPAFWSAATAAVPCSP